MNVPKLDAHDVLNLLAGFALGLLPLIIPAALSHYHVLRSGIRNKYRGRFYLYHWSGTDPNAIRDKVIILEISLMGTLRATMPQDTITSLSFRGELNISPSGIMYLDLVGIGHEERIMIVLNAPITSAFVVTTGVFCALDLAGTPSAFKAVLSRKPLSHEEAYALIGFRQLLKAPRLPTSTAADIRP